MVSVQKNNESSYLISLSPNSSLEGKYRILFLLSITIICGGIGIIFFFLGASLILPFAGLELTILFIAFYLSFRWSSKKEKIYISEEIVKIEKGFNKADYLWKEFRTFTSFNIEKDKNKSLKLSFRSKGENVFVGDFLNDDDKVLLKNAVREIIDELNSKSFKRSESL